MPAPTARNPALRDQYASAALAEIPRLLGAVDRNPFRPTYGCLDREYWHYRTAGFPSGMHQEGCLALALVYTRPLPGNRWHGEPRVRELAVAAIRFAARSSHADGSCDDYYPYERALGATVFSLLAAARTYQILELNDSELIAWLRRRAGWVAAHDESGRLANHQALAALGLLRVAQITADPKFRDAADQRIRKVLEWQDEEGWFDEYGGADPGYQTVTIDCLAQYRRLTGMRELDEPLRRAVAFARLFLHPDGSFGGEYGSRGTYHFYPHGFELLAGDNPDAADLADGFLDALAVGEQAHFSDDRLYFHRLPSLIGAYIDWSPLHAGEETGTGFEPTSRFLPRAGLLVRRSGPTCTIVSAARGGVFKHFAPGASPVTDAGLVIETVGGRVAVSQMHDRTRRACEKMGTGSEPRSENSGETASGEVPVPIFSPVDGSGERLSVSGPLHWARSETATPLKQAVFHTAMVLVGRWCRTLVRRCLQRRLITGRRECPIRLSRTFEFPSEQAAGPACLRVTDVVELLDPRVQVRRMSYGTDHQTVYVAASGVYQESVLTPWTDLAEHVQRLNSDRRVTIVRELPTSSRR